MMKKSGIFLFLSIYILFFSGCGEEDTREDTLELSIDSEQNVKVGATVTLDASKSYDINLGSRLMSYKWSSASTDITLSDANDSSPTFVANTAGEYSFDLLLNDSLKKNVKINVTAKATNAKPTANAGLSKNVKVARPMRLDASASTDADNDTLTYRWSLRDPLPKNSNAFLQNPTQPSPIFTPDVEGDYIFGLTVSDTKANSTPSYVTIKATQAHLLPTAEAGKTIYVKTSSYVKLDALDSLNLDIGNTNYMWSIISKPDGSKATLAGINTFNPKFQADLDGSYVIALSLNGGQSSDTILIKASRLNQPPTADAGADRYIKQDLSVVKLDGSKSIDTQTPITYEWHILSQPQDSNISLENPKTVFPSFLPKNEGTYIFSLVVNDGLFNSQVDTVAIYVASQNLPPIANAGKDLYIKVDSEIVIDGSNSIDSNDGSLDYQWSVDGNDYSIAEGSSLSLKLTKEGTHIVGLIVNDAQMFSNKDYMTLRCYADSIPTYVDLGQTRTALRKNTISINNAKGGNANVTSHSWRLISKPKVSTARFSTTNQKQTSIITDKLGYYIVSLTLNSTKEDEDTNILIIETENDKPKAIIAQVPPRVDAKDSYTLDGSLSEDNDELTYIWRVIHQPVSKTTSALLQDNIEKPKIDVGFKGTYIFGLVVYDGIEYSVEANVSIESVAGYGLTIRDREGNGYKAVKSPYATGKFWLDRNLGASRVCKTLDDEACFGDYYQWGRGRDGHEKINSEVATDSTFIPLDLEDIGSKFIPFIDVEDLQDYDKTGLMRFHPSLDWTVTSDLNGSIRVANWNKTDGSFCPKGFRVPTLEELKAETVNTIDGMNEEQAIKDNFLKLPYAGKKNFLGVFNYMKLGYYWSTHRTYGDYYSYALSFPNALDDDYDETRFLGLPIRCIED